MEILTFASFMMVCGVVTFNLIEFRKLDRGHRMVVSALQKVTCALERIEKRMDKSDKQHEKQTRILERIERRMEKHEKHLEGQTRILERIERRMEKHEKQHWRQTRVLERIGKSPHIAD